MVYIHLKEVQHSPKFGRVLPIDFEYNNGQINYYPTDEIFSEIKDYFTKKESPDYIWLKGINDISLFLSFSRLLNKIKETFPNQKMGVYINSSLFSYFNVRKVLLLCDLVVINLNSVVPSKFYKSCICNEDINIEDILDGIKSFRKEFKGYFSIYTMFLKDINDNLDDVTKLKYFLLEVKPNHLSVNIFTRSGFVPISEKSKQSIKGILKELPFKVSFTF